MFIITLRNYWSIAILHALVNVISLSSHICIFVAWHLTNLAGEIRVEMSPNLQATLAYSFSNATIFPISTFG